MTTLDRFQRNLDRLKISGPDGLRLWLALPESERRRMEARKIVQLDDRRVADGHVEFVKGKYQDPRNRRPGRSARHRIRAKGDSLNQQFDGPVDWRRGTEALASIPAETYLAILVPESDPHRGKCRCPLPDHEDNNPSATFRDSVWYCHVCATGGGIFTLGAALSGHYDHGPEFHELRRWLAERLLGVRA